MSLLSRVVFAARCRSTHHKLAIDALDLLDLSDAEDWRNLFLKYHEPYLEGAKAPDDSFKDFRNHVLHVRDGFWGGAPQAAAKWYSKTVAALAADNWPEAAYAAGVLSHYVTDPVMPMHTGQSEDEGPVHRPLEWSVTRSYDTLRQILEDDLGGFPEIELGNKPDWLESALRAAATVAHQHYDVLIDHYDLHAGVRNPPAGFDRDSQVRVAGQIGYAASLFAGVLERAIDEADAIPPQVNLSVAGVIAALNLPAAWIHRNLTNLQDRLQVQAIYREFAATGKVIASLPEDDRVVRAAHAAEVLKVPLADLDARPIRKPGAKHGEIEKEISPRSAAPVAPAQLTQRPTRAATPPAGPAPIPAEPPKSEPPRTEKSAAPPVVDVPQVSRTSEPRPQPQPPVSTPQPERVNPPAREEVAAVPPLARLQSMPERPAAQAPAEPRYFLDLTRPVVDAPSIGPKTADRLSHVGIHTVSDLLEQEPEHVAKRLNVKHITADVIRDWQWQAWLVCEVPGLRGHDAQMIVGAGVTDPEELANQSPPKLLARVEEFLETEAGERVIRSGKRPDLAEVTEWIGAARNDSSRRAA